MSTLLIVVIVVVALIVIAMLVAASRKSARRRELGQAQAEARHDDVRHHRERADESRTEAAIAEERAKRSKVEAELNEERADARERELREWRQADFQGGNQQEEIEMAEAKPKTQAKKAKPKAICVRFLTSRM